MCQVKRALTPAPLAAAGQTRTVPAPNKASELLWCSLCASQRKTHVRSAASQIRCWQPLACSSSSNQAAAHSEGERNSPASPTGAFRFSLSRPALDCRLLQADLLLLLLLLSSSPSLSPLGHSNWPISILIRTANPIMTGQPFH